MGDHILGQASYTYFGHSAFIAYYEPLTIDTVDSADLCLLQTLEQLRLVSPRVSSLLH